MKSAALALCLALIAPAAAAGQSAVPLREVRFSGPSAVDQLCACLLDLRRSAEAQGRLWWLRRGAAAVGNVALVALIP